MTKRLGRGLADLIEATPQHNASFVMLNTEQVRPGRLQPRSAIRDDSLEELKASIKRTGVIEPIIVRPLAHGTYELVAGERRLRASQALGIREVPAIIKQLGDREALEFSLVENVQRENLNPIEEAKGCARLLEEFGYTQEEIAAAVGKDRATIANMLRLLALPDEIQQGVRDGAVTAGHAKALLGIETRARQLELYRLIIARELSVRATEALVIARAPGKRRRANRTDPHLSGFEDGLRRALGTKVRLVSRAKGGRIIIEYFSSDDLARVLQLLGVSV